MLLLSKYKNGGGKAGEGSAGTLTYHSQHTLANLFSFVANILRPPRQILNLLIAVVPSGW